MRCPNRKLLFSRGVGVLPAFLQRGYLPPASLLVGLLLAPPLADSAEASFYWANPQPTGNELGGIEFESTQTGYAVGEFGSSLRTTDGGLTWQSRNDPDALAPTLHDILVLSSGVLLAAGEAPGLFLSTDGGASWTPVANPANGVLQNLFSLGGGTIFAVGNGGKVLRSADGGVSFTSLTTPGPGNLVDQYWLDTQHGFVIGNSRVRRTTDGGQTWTTIPGVPETNLSFPGDIDFLDSMNGWILTDFATYRTTNGGATWFSIPTQFGSAPIYQEEQLALSSQIRLVGTEGEGAEIWKTTNDGTTWTRMLDYGGARGVTDLERLPNGVIVATTTAGDLLRSSDDGNTWINATTVAGPAARANLNAVDLLPGGVGFAGGYGSSWIQTTDGGRNWFDPAATPGLSSVFAIRMRDPLFILAGGIGTNGHSDVRRSTDGGATWTTHDLAPGYVGYPQGIVAFPDGTCFCATYGGSNINFVYRSLDDGVTWQLRSNGLPANLRLFDIDFLDPQTGFACGGDGLTPFNLYRTTDGGGTWTPVGQTGLLIGTIQDMHWMTPTRGFVVGDSRIQRTTDGGATWTTMVPNGPWSALDFRDTQYGVATELGSAVWITTDGGDSWTRKVLPAGMFFGDVAATTDGFLVAGGQNSVLGWGEATTSVPMDQPLPAALAGRLLVWPNPVDPVRQGLVHLRMNGPGSGIREARLYDMQGRRLAAASGREGETEIRIEFGGLALPGGMYVAAGRCADGSWTTAKVSVVR